ncbi:MAG: glycosyltransferase [Clostridiaceae bacterium]|jgi:glycosyltransferase involved in cell wall biosynthesis|nr:glycosyltransferase [Clostridiaceae bacterium]
MLISIIVASYNYENFIGETIKSVLNQTYSDWELIIVDDGSSDNSVEVIRNFCAKDKRIKLYTHQDNKNKGLVKTLQLGISYAKGDWIAFLESDDKWTPDCLEKRIQEIKKNKDFSLIFNTVQLTGDEKKIQKMQKVVDDTRKHLLKHTYPKNMFMDFAIDNQIVTFSTVMLSRKILDNFDWDCPCDKLFDWWFYIHLAYKNDFYYLNEPLTFWQVHDNSYINQTSTTVLPQFRAYYDVYNMNKSIFLLIKICYLFLFFLCSFKPLKTLKTKIARKLKSFNQK